jgi:hypothetical protein
MGLSRYRRGRSILCGLICVAAIYSIWFYQRRALTGNQTVDGTLSVLLGLYICARPAGNAIDLLFFERTGFRQIATQWYSIQWLLLNILTLLMGWLVIYFGTAHLTGQAG